MAAKAGVSPSLKNPMAYQRANVLGSQMVLEMARKHGVKKVILASSSSVYGDVPECTEDLPPRPISPYAASKVGMEAIGHTYSKLYGMKIAALRFFTVYGPRQRPDLAMFKFAEKMSNGEGLEIFGHGTERDFTYIDDIVEGIVLAVEQDISGFNVINLGGGSPASPRQVIDVLAKLMRVEPEVEVVEYRKGDVTRTLANVRRAKEILGWEPKTRLEDGLGRFVTWFRKSAQNKVLDGI
jgi:UDP-glucuronate 4-epimerase